MFTMKHAVLVGLAVATAVAACADASGGRVPTTALSSGERPGSGAAAPKRIVAAVMAVQKTLNVRSIGPGRPMGFDALEALVSASLANGDDRGQLRPQLAASVPTAENGLWRVFSDGRMETTWKVNPAAQWQDGVPFTSDDMLFTGQVAQDPELLNFRDSAYAFVDGLDAPDRFTFTVRWNRPFIDADQLYTTYLRLVPLPRHLLERAYLENKANFLELPYWREEFVGTGPYKLREWALDSHVVLDANDRYVLGRPQVDTIEVRFIPDGNTLVANIRAGEVEMTMGRALSLDQALQLRDQWRDGKLDISLDRNWIAIYPQMINPSPRVIGDVRFRRALVQAIDRQEMVETIQHGLVPVADTIVSPNEPEYREVERSIVRYTFDSRAAAQAISDLGYTVATDGSFRDAANQRLGVEIRTTGGDGSEKAMFAVADYWQRIGLGVETIVIPGARANDREYRHTRSGFELIQQPFELDRYRSSQVPLPENNFTGQSKHRYMNAELDALLDSYFVAIPLPERVGALGQIIHHISDQVVPLPLYYAAVPTMIGNRLRNIRARNGRGSTEAWNAELWDVESSR